MKDESNENDDRQHEDPSPFVARKSKRFIRNEAASDGDVWQEHLIVVQVESQGKRKAKQNGQESEELQLRSYFQSKQTGQRTWDEPPSGASTILYASEEAKQMALLQMSDIEIVTPPDSESNGGNPDCNTTKDSRSNSFRQRLTNLMSRKKDEPNNPSVLSYKQGSFTESFFQEERIQRRLSSEESNIQLALAMSLKTEQDDSIDQEEREAIALAKALSLSETENTDVILRQVLERSKDETNGYDPYIGEAFDLKKDRDDYEDTII